MAFPAGKGSWHTGKGTPIGRRDDKAFLADVARDLRQRLPVSGVFLSGHSTGAAMVYGMACHGDGSYDGFLPISGGFWAPLPNDCAAPARPVQHLHGASDTIWEVDGGGWGAQSGAGDSLAVLHVAWSCAPAAHMVERPGDRDCTTLGELRRGALRAPQRSAQAAAGLGDLACRLGLGPGRRLTPRAWESHRHDLPSSISMPRGVLGWPIPPAPPKPRRWTPSGRATAPLARCAPRRIGARLTGEPTQYGHLCWHRPRRTPGRPLKGSGGNHESATPAAATVADFDHRGPPEPADQ